VKSFGILHSLEVQVTSGSEDLQLGINESYKLSIEGSSAGAVLKAETVFGAIYGLETFTQLVVNYHQVEEKPFVVRGVPVSIEDQPRFSWRGLLVDTGRHYYQVDFILHIIDSLVANKMNVFQLSESII